MGLFKKKSVKRKRPIIESLEPRILLSADLPGLDLPDFDPDDPLDADVDQILARAEEAFLAAAADADAASAYEPQQQAAVSAPVDDPDTALPANETPDDVRRELIIVDPSVPDKVAARSWAGAAFGDRSLIADLRRTSIYPPAAFVDDSGHSRPAPRTAEISGGSHRCT